MELSKIVIKNYRSIKNQEVIFYHNFMVLVGINESGKSNVLRAVALLDPAASVSKDDVRDPGHDEEVVSESWVRFHFRLKQTTLLRAYISFKDQILSTRTRTPLVDIHDSPYGWHAFFSYKSEVMYTIQISSGNRNYSHWGFHGPQYRVHPQWKKLKPAGKSTLVLEGLTIDFAKHTIINTEDYPQVPDEHLEELDFEFLNSRVGDALIKMPLPDPVWVPTTSCGLSVM